MGKGHRSSSCIGHQHKNKVWKKKADIEVLLDMHLEDIADGGGDEEHRSVVISD